MYTRPTRSSVQNNAKKKTSADIMACKTREIISQWAIREVPK